MTKHGQIIPFLYEFGAAIIAAVATLIAGMVSYLGEDKWPRLVPLCLALISTSLLGLWMHAFVNHRRLVRQFGVIHKAHAQFEAFVHSQLDSELVVKHPELGVYGPLLVRAAQSITFDGSHVDDEIWIKFGKDIIFDLKMKPSEKLDYILQVKKTHKLTVKIEYTYMAIDYLFRRVKRYWAVASEEELSDKDAKHFLLSKPLNYHHIEIYRIFLVSSVSVFASLAEDDRNYLAQQLRREPRIQLRYLVKDTNDLPPVCGIYDDVAVGTMEKLGMCPFTVELMV